MKQIKQITELEKAISVFDDIASEIRSGNIPALTPYIKSKLLLKRLEKFDGEIRENALEEASMYEKTFSIEGVNVEYRNGSGRYSFKHDAEWCAVKEQEDKLAAVRKEREELMKSALRHGGEFVFDGEIIPPAKVTYNKDSLIVK